MAYESDLDALLVEGCLMIFIELRPSVDTLPLKVWIKLHEDRDSSYKIADGHLDQLVGVASLRN